MLLFTKYHSRIPNKALDNTNDALERGQNFHEVLMTFDANCNQSIFVQYVQEITVRSHLPFKIDFSEVDDLN